MDSLPSWAKNPKSITTTTDPITTVVFIDENGHSDMKEIKKKADSGKAISENSIHFSVTAVTMPANELSNTKNNLDSIKTKHWVNGCYPDKNGHLQKVCFHSRDIRKQTDAFSKNEIDRDTLMEDINSFMESLPITLTSCYVNKELLYKRYKDMAYDPYRIAITFILERIVQWQTKDSDRIYIILESRGKKEDKKVLDTIVDLIRFGSTYVNGTYFQKIIGVYFNPKRPKEDNLRSYFGLEVADLCAYPIFKYCRSNVKDRAFLLLENKIYGFPFYMGKGIKKFPK